MEEILRQNLTAVFGLLGTILGALVVGILSLLSERGRSQRELRSRLWEKVLDRRIEAHEQIIHFAKSMRLSASLGFLDSDGELVRFPGVLQSKESFHDWYVVFSKTLISTSTWLSIDLTREMHLVQDYVATLEMNLQKAPSDVYPKVGIIIRQDFLDFSSRLEKLAFDFFTRDLYELKLSDPGARPYFKTEETRERMNATNFMTRWDEIEALVGAGQV